MISNCFILLQDTAGQERFRAVVKQLYLNSDGVLVVFDLSKPATLKNIPRWIDEVYQNTTPTLPIILIGNKCDLVDENNTLRNEALNLAKQFNISYMETSAMNATNVEKAFIMLATNIFRKKKSRPVNDSNQSTSPFNDPEDTRPIVREPTIILRPHPSPIKDDDQLPDSKKKGCC